MKKSLEEIRREALQLALESDPGGAEGRYWLEVAQGVGRWRGDEEKETELQAHVEELEDRIIELMRSNGDMETELKRRRELDENLDIREGLVEGAIEVYCHSSPGEAFIPGENAVLHGDGWHFNHERAEIVYKAPSFISATWKSGAGSVEARVHRLEERVVLDRGQVFLIVREAMQCLMSREPEEQATAAHPTETHETTPGADAITYTLERCIGAPGQWAISDANDDALLFITELQPAFDLVHGIASREEGWTAELDASLVRDLIEYDVERQHLNIKSRLSETERRLTECRAMLRARPRDLEQRAAALSRLDAIKEMLPSLGLSLRHATTIEDGPGGPREIITVADDAGVPLQHERLKRLEQQRVERLGVPYSVPYSGKRCLDGSEGAFEYRIDYLVHLGPEEGRDDG